MRKWVSPKAVEEKFSVNEAVSACIEGTIQCYYPGKSPYEGNDGTDTIKISKDFAAQDKWVTTGEWHGLCGNDAHISFNSETGSGYEVVNGKTDYQKPIKNIKNYTMKEGTYTNVIWNSYDGHNGGGEYHHRGTLTINNIITNRPNHS